MRSPLVTVVIPAYNAAKTICRAVDSALAQDYPATEILVIDDGSKDGTSEVVTKQYKRAGVRLLQLACNQGESGAMNKGIASANGEYIAFLDADDEWMPQKLSRQIAALETNPHAVMATCGCKFMDPQGNVRELFGKKKPGGVPKDQIWRALLRRTYIAKPCVVARASALAAVGPFDTTLRISADQDMWIRLSLTGEVEFVCEFLTMAHDTPGSLTKTYRRDEDIYGLKVVLHHIQAQKHRLSQEEIRDILAERYTSLGRNIYLAGQTWRGGRLLLRAIALGRYRRQNFWYLLTASPVARHLKAALRQSDRTTNNFKPGSPQHGALFYPAADAVARIPEGPPILIVGVDLEAEFDWNGPRPRTSGVSNVREQIRADRILEKYGVRPIYLVDYEVASRATGFRPLQELVAAGRCEIGSHLQPWETPPYVEELSERTSYPHNLPAWVQREKLRTLTAEIELNLGVHPAAYRAGRYGIGEEIGQILADFGYTIDMSVVPGIDLRFTEGPDFRPCFCTPFWFGPQYQLLEIPITAGFCGALSSLVFPRGFATEVYSRVSKRSMRRIRGPGIVARLGLLERITLTPEGIGTKDMRRLLLKLWVRGQRVFSLNYHSSSLLPGCTPYVRTLKDRDEFLDRLQAFLDIFFGDLRGIAMTPSEFRSFIVQDTR